MQVESRKNRPNKKAKRLNSVRGTQRFTKPSQTNGGANIQIKTEIAIPKLQNLAEKYIGVSNPYGFLTDLRNALGIPNSKGASKYGVVEIPKEDGSILQASLRITNHNSNAETYITHNANYEYNLSILVRKNFKPNTFVPHDDVRLDEFVYYGKKMAKVENPLTQIINGIISFLQSGEYTDTTGVAFKNQSPQPKTENKQYNTNMNKKLIRLTESDLHRIVKESVQKILKEAAYQGNYPGMDNGYGRFEMNHPEGKYSLYFDKAQRDAHNYNAQQQGQTPNPYAGWSKRVNDGKGNWNDAEFNSDDMHMYNDDDASQTAANLRKFDPNGAYHWDMFRGRGDKFR